MNDFLSSMKSLVLYQHITKEKRNDKSKFIDSLEDEIQFEMIKFKKAISSSPTPIKVKNLDFRLTSRYNFLFLTKRKLLEMTKYELVLTS